MFAVYAKITAHFSLFGEYKQKICTFEEIFYWYKKYFYHVQILYKA